MCNVYIAGGGPRRSISSPAPESKPQHHQQQQQAAGAGVESAVGEMKSEMARELERLNKRIDGIDKQITTMLQLLLQTTAAHSAAAADVTDKKTAAVSLPPHSPSYMQTISEQEEDCWKPS